MFTGEQKRNSFRLVYPPNDRPKATEAEIYLADISRRGVKILVDRRNHDFNPEKPVKLHFQLDSGQEIFVGGTILRTSINPKSHELFFVVKLDVAIPIEFINDEQKYLLKHYPNFCRANF